MRRPPNQMPEPQLSVLEPDDAEAGPSAARGYSVLHRAVRDAGLLDRRHGFYIAKILGTDALFAVVTVVFLSVGDSWWQLLTAVAFAVLFTQFGFIGHDAGHRQIFSSRRANAAVGYLHGDLLIGLGYGWWVDKHNAHHANPNHEDHDPDVNLGVLAFTVAQAVGPASGARGALGRYVIRHQAGLFFPMLLLEGIDLHVSAVRSLVRREVPALRTEIVLLAVHAVVYFGAVFLVLSPLRAVAFIVVHQAAFGLYLGCSFAPSHKGMPMLTAADKLDPLRKQVLTSRNIVGNRVLDVVLGGLNYQIEHHLFPRMPMTNLRRAQPLVREFCRREGVPYAETTLLDSYARALRHLQAVSASAPY